MPSVLAVPWITETEAGHCCPYRLRTEEQLKAGPRPPWGAALVGKCPTGASPPLPSCLVPMTLRRPGQFRMYQSAAIPLGVPTGGDGERQTELPAWSNRNPYSENECQTKLARDEIQNTE